MSYRTPVKNAPNTSERKPSSFYSSWLNYWESVQQCKAMSCCVVECINPAEIGAHVTNFLELNINENDYFIVPMCNQCSSKSSSALIIVNHDHLVSEEGRFI